MPRRPWSNVLLACVAACALAAPGSARADDVVITEEARTHFAAGVALLKDPKAPRYEDAYREFKAAYAAAPSYKILGNLGLCAMQIERDNEAINAYDSYLKLAGAELTPGELEQIKSDLLTLRAGVVQVTVSSEPPGASITDVRVPVQGPEVKNSYGQILTPLILGLRRGHHVITAKLSGYQDAQWEFDTAEDHNPQHVFRMVPPVAAIVRAPERVEQPMIRERPIPNAAYASMAATGGLVLVGTFFGALALHQHSVFEQENHGTTSGEVAQATSDRNKGLVLDGVTDACFGGAIVLAGLTSYFLVTRPTVERPASYSLQVLPTWTGRAPGVGALVSF